MLTKEELSHEATQIACDFPQYNRYRLLFEKLLDHIGEQATEIERLDTAFSVEQFCHKNDVERLEAEISRILRVNQQMGDENAVTINGLKNEVKELRSPDYLCSLEAENDKLITQLASAREIIKLVRCDSGCIGHRFSGHDDSCAVSRQQDWLANNKE